MLVNMSAMLKAARAEHTAIGAFNIANYETAVAVIQAAEAEKRPVIIQLYQRLFNSVIAYDLQAVLERLAKRAAVPVALHLDHGATLKQVENALAWGYTSVMYDGSTKPYAENVANTAHAAALAQAKGATCEGEIGHVAQGDEMALTQVEEAVSFAKATGVDALAISIGTAHGYYKITPKIDVARCREIAEALPGLPLVLHGGSGTPLGDVRKVIEAGIAKVNIATEYMDTYLKSTQAELVKLDGKFLPIDKFIVPTIDACAAHAQRLIRWFAGK